MIPALWSRLLRKPTESIAFDTALATTGAAAACRVFELDLWGDLGSAGRRAIDRRRIGFVRDSRLRLRRPDSSRSTVRAQLVHLWLAETAWAIPYYLREALGAFGMALISAQFGWQTVVASGPAVYLIYRSYRVYLQRLEDQKRHAEEMAGRSISGRSKPWLWRSKQRTTRRMSICGASRFTLARSGRS